ncbi:two-partner secretion domain-containing protein [Fischerella sp. PCC 9605]|uniref:two-partner secretion domain-containing protein n=1 Tax=Fischerella sp. PCC 9605 TaxID=1173024 RepID=UPI0004B4BABA|nr:filamentous hemagglutinin N-terminal domain-containing protein [Fischerella sp. PCC 9605]
MRSLFFITLTITTLSSLAPLSTATAQITPDNSLGAESSVVTGDVINDIPSDRIEGGATRGSNLFHSFQEFNVGEGRGAYFSNPAGIANILTRVTGANLSNILGTLGVIDSNGVVGKANLFLINPNGIFFGQKARLNLGGSFLATTADSLVFDNNFEFSATNPQAPPQLTINIPIGLRFRDKPGAISVQGPGNNLQFDPEFLEFKEGPTPEDLAVQPGKTLALVGGNVTLEGGNLIADGGRIEVGSVGSSSLVSITPVAKGWQLGYAGVPSFQDISLSKKASIDTSSDAAAGEIQVRGRNIKVTDGSAIFAFTGSQPGGTLSINASDTLEVTGISTNNSVPSTIYSAVYPNGTGSGSDLIIQTGRLIAQGGSQTGADTFGVGSAGNVIINASESVEIKGDVVITGISSEGEVKDFTVPTAIGTILQADSTGSGAQLTLETQQLKIEDGGALITGTLGEGEAATLKVKASESTELIGEGSAISSLTDISSGDGGTIILETPRLLIRDGAEITVSGKGDGDAGELRVTSRSIRLENGLVLENGLKKRKGIAATANSGNGGDIYLDVQDYLLMGGESIISASAVDGNGGNIFINNLTNYRGFIIARPSQNSDITANAGTGQGGRVDIKSNGIFGLVPRSRQDLERLLNTTNPDELDPINLLTNDITAISQQNPSLSGTVTINTPDVDPSQGLTELPENVADPTEQIAQNPCQIGVGSEFTITGRGGLPANPNQNLSHNNARVDLVEPATSTSSSQSATINQPIASTTAKRIVPAQGWVLNNKGEVVLVAYDPTATNLTQRSLGKIAACPAPF